MSKVVKLPTKKKAIKKSPGSVSFLPMPVQNAPKTFICTKHGEVETSLQLGKGMEFCPTCFGKFLEKNKVNKVEVKSKLISFDEYNSAIKQQKQTTPEKFPRKNGLECPTCSKELLDVDGIVMDSIPMKTKIKCSDSKCDYMSSRLVMF